MKLSALKSTTQKYLCTIAFSGLLFSSSALMAGDELAKEHLEKDKVLATVNGQSVTESQLEIAAAQSKVNFEEITTVQKKLLTEALINRQLVLDEAIKANYDKTPDIAARVKALTESYIAANYLATIAKEFKVDDASMKIYYDKNVLGNPPKEYKARHILVKTEEEAKSLIEEIDGGADFSKLAKNKSTDVGSGSRGGDLDWFSEQDMVAPFSKVIATLKKGELSKAAVNSQFGWHVIILDDIRTKTPPEFNAVKQNIEKVLIKEKLNEYLENLNAKATILLK